MKEYDIVPIQLFNSDRPLFENAGNISFNRKKLKRLSTEEIARRLRKSKSSLDDCCRRMNVILLIR